MDSLLHRSYQISIPLLRLWNGVIPISHIAAGCANRSRQYIQVCTVSQARTSDRHQTSTRMENQIAFSSPLLWHHTALPFATSLVEFSTRKARVSACQANFDKHERYFTRSVNEKSQSCHTRVVILTFHALNSVLYYYRRIDLDF